MIFFHLFGASINYKMVGLYTTFTTVPRLFSLFCGNTVAIFVFVSGYGLSMSKELSLRKILNKSLVLYVTSWIISIIFVPIVILLGYEKISIKEILKTFLCIGGYNKMYWYIALYPLILLTHKMVKKLHLKNLIVIQLIIIAVFLFNKDCNYLSQYKLFGFFLNNYLMLLPFLFSGIIVSKTNVSGIYIYRYSVFIILFIILGGLIILNNKLGNIYYYIYCVYTIPLLCLAFSSVNIFRKSRLLLNLGSLSMIIWLTHGFLLYYKLFYWPKYWLFVYIIFCICAYIVAYTTDKIIKLLRIDSKHIKL